jgi:peptidoglycan hydrolase-like protein with peptidoglycan-binding domain
MEVLSHKKIKHVVPPHDMTRIYEMDDSTWLAAHGGTIAWRNNNPGNLKFEYAGSAEKNKARRDKKGALSKAQETYKGVVDLDQWGNAIFESYEAGRKAQRQLVLKSHANHTVKQLVEGYSTRDYSGNPHHDNQIQTIYATAMKAGHDLSGKKVKDMSPEEIEALLDGISRAEEWRAGTVQQTPPMTKEQEQAFVAAHSRAHDAPAANVSIAEAHAEHTHAGHANLHGQGDHSPAVSQLQGDLAALGVTARDGSSIHPDQRFGGLTNEAPEAFQTAHDPLVDGVSGPATTAAITQAKAPHTPTQASVPDLPDAGHPAHGIYEQAYSCAARLDESRGRDIGPHTQALAGSLTSAATAAGFNRIDHVTLSDDATQCFAIQGALNAPLKQYAAVNVMQAVQTPLPQSSQEAAAHLQNNAQQQKPVQQAALSPVM